MLLAGRLSNFATQYERRRVAARAVLRLNDPDMRVTVAWGGALLESGAVARISDATLAFYVSR